MFRKFSVQACGAAAALAALAGSAVLPGTADAAVTGAFSYPLVTVHLAGQTAAAPGRLEATLHTNACVSHVSAYALNLRTGDVLKTTADPKSGRTAVVTFTVPKAAKAGRYELAGAFGRPCADTAGAEQLNPAGGYFTAAFTVTAKK
jgi:H+/gluconate symporter-like permease